MKNLIKKMLGIKSEKEMNIISFRKAFENLSTTIHSKEQYNAYMETMLLLCNNIDYREIAAKKTAEIDTNNKQLIDLIATLESKNKYIADMSEQNEKLNAIIVEFGFEKKALEKHISELEMINSLYLEKGLEIDGLNANELLLFLEQHYRYLNIDDQEKAKGLIKKSGGNTKDVE